MKDKMQYSGFAIALAWPKTYCKQPGSWYDSLANFVGISHNHYYKVGHAAIVLIDSAMQRAYYFDFGRYHSPFQNGRARGEETDHELRIATRPIISKDETLIVNYIDILGELMGNDACHGVGALYASYCRVNFSQAYSRAVHMQNQIFIPYGPFRWGGSNCSRFVKEVIVAGNPSWRNRLMLHLLNPITPTPRGNVDSLGNRVIIPDLTYIADRPSIDAKRLRSTLAAPLLHKEIPADAQWLGGEGAGSWFSFGYINGALSVKRYDPKGRLECSGTFATYKGRYSKEQIEEAKVDFPSNCKIVTLLIEGNQIQFHRIS